MMFNSGGAVLKRGYVWNQTETAATMCNWCAATICNWCVKMTAASFRPPPAVSTRRWPRRGCCGSEV